MNALSGLPRVSEGGLFGEVRVRRPLPLPLDSCIRQLMKEQILHEVVAKKSAGRASEP